MEKEINAKKVLYAFKKYAKTIIIVPILLALLCYVASSFIPPKYEASSQVVVYKKDDKSPINDATSNLQLVSTFAEILESPEISKEISKEMNGKYSPEEIASMYSVKSNKESQVITIQVNSENRQDTVEVAQKAATAFEKEAKSTMNLDSVSTIYSPDKATQTAPQPLKYAIITFVVSIIVILILVAIRELFKKQIKSKEDVENNLDLNVLGDINTFK